MTEMEVYWGSGSQPSWRVLLALELKEIAYESKLISLQKGDHRTPDFVEMNPRQKVPTIKHGDFVCSESIAILAYLDACYPEPPLFGTVPEETGEIWRRIMEFINYAEPPLMSIVRGLFFGQFEERRDEIVANVPKAAHELDLLERDVRHRGYFVEDRVSAVDLVIYPTVASLLRAAQKPGFEELNWSIRPFETAYPGLFRWLEEMERLPGYEKTYPPHWRG